MSISISNVFNLVAAKEAYSKPLRNTDSNTIQACNSAQKANHDSGLAVGLNDITYWKKSEGIMNRLLTNPKERDFLQEKGFYPSATYEWIA